MSIQPHPKPAGIIATHVETIVFVIALVMRGAYLLTLQISEPIRADALKYATIAYNLAERGVYSSQIGPSPVPDAFITPGYPLLLAALYELTGSIAGMYHAALWLQVLAGAGTAALCCAIGRRFLPLWGVCLAGIATALSPVLIVGTGYLLTETLFAFTLALSMLVFLRAMEANSLAWAGIAGLVLGFSALVRPAILLWPIFAGIMLWLFCRDRKAGTTLLAALVLGTVLAWAPWAAWSKLGAPDGKSNARATLAMGIYPDFTHQNPALKGFPYRDDPRFNEISGSYAAIARELAHRARKEPVRYAMWYLAGKPLAFWSGSEFVGMGGPFVYEVKQSLYHASTPAYWTLFCMYLIHPFVLCLAVLGCVLAFAKASRDGNAPAMLVALVVIYATALHSVFSALPRYGFPFFPVLYLVAAFGLTRLAEHARQAWRKRTEPHAD